MTRVAEYLKKISEIGTAVSAPEVWGQLKAMSAEFGATVLLVVGKEEAEGTDPTSRFWHPVSPPHLLHAVNEAVRDPEFERLLADRSAVRVSQLASRDGPLAKLLELAADGGDAFLVPVGNGESARAAVVFAGPALQQTQFARALMFIGACAAINHAIALGMPQVPGKRVPGALTEREVECLRWLSVGKSDSEISIILGISPRTVRFHIDNAKVKLGAATRIQAVAKALREQAIAA